VCVRVVVNVYARRQTSTLNPTKRNGSTKKVTRLRVRETDKVHAHKIQACVCVYIHMYTHIHTCSHMYTYIYSVAQVMLTFGCTLTYMHALYEQYLSPERQKNSSN